MSAASLESLLKKAKSIRTLSLEEVATIGLELAACRTAIDEAIEPIRERLRAGSRQLRKAEGDEVVEVVGQNDSGKVTVTFSANVPTMSRAFSDHTLRLLLGDNVDRYFREHRTLVPREDFAEVCAERKRHVPKEVTIAIRAVNLDEPTPRVGFRFKV